MLKSGNCPPCPFEPLDFLSGYFQDREPLEPLVSRLLPKTEELMPRAGLGQDHRRTGDIPCFDWDMDTIVELPIAVN